jgi:hypothetical protein
MGTDPRQTSGDYGYDLVHEDIGEAPPASSPGPGGSPPPSGRTTDHSEDLAYDEAHDF